MGQDNHESGRQAQIFALRSGHVCHGHLPVRRCAVLLHYAMNIGHGDIIDDELGPPRVEAPNVNEHAQLWFYRSWADWMAADGWDDLEHNHTIPEDRV